MGHKRLFQGEGREHPKELIGKGGSRMLETADKLLGWSPRGAELRSESRQSWGLWATHYPDGNGELWKSLGWRVGSANSSYATVGLKDRVYLRNIIFQKYRCHLCFIATVAPGSRLPGLRRRRHRISVPAELYVVKPKQNTRAHKVHPRSCKHQEEIQITQRNSILEIVLGTILGRGS